MSVGSVCLRLRGPSRGGGDREPEAHGPRPSHLSRPKLMTGARQLLSLSGSQEHSSNLRMPKAVLKLHSSDTVRVWWVPILARGKLHVEELPENFPGETEAGAEMMVRTVRAALNIRFRDSSAPTILYTDRGNGFYHVGTGNITPRYRDALRSHDLKAFFPSDASVQPGQLQDLLLHETAVSWMRVQLAKTRPKKDWEETVGQYVSRLKAAAAHINANHNVEGLGKEWPQRLHDLDAAEGDRLGK